MQKVQTIAKKGQKSAKSAEKYKKVQKVQNIDLTLFLLGGPFGPQQPKTVWTFHILMAVVTKVHDFVYFSTCLVPVKLFLKKNHETL